MSQAVTTEFETRSYWPKGLALKFITALTGVLAIFVALKAAAYTPNENPVFDNQDHLFRILAFAALTVWISFTIGVRRRGAAAMIALIFACFVELVIVPARGDSMGTLVSANLGIVLAYCAMHLYWLGLVKKRLAK